MYLSKKRIARTLSESQQRTWRKKELLAFIGESREEWETQSKSADTISIPSSATTTTLMNKLVSEKLIQAMKLDFPYRASTRYSFQELNTFEVIQSTDAKGYFSHYTAMHLHGLTDQIAKSIYFNVEQPAVGGGGSLTQGGIDRALKGKCRVTNNVTNFRDVTIHKTNGQNTGRLGVESFELDSKTIVEVTNLERTLIDIAVRPVYAGGIAEVANAYRAAAERVSGNRLVTYLKKLNYTYPYHQAIGFYMDRAGNYSESQLRRIFDLPKEFNFYLTYQIKNAVLNEKWKLFIPDGF